MDCMFTVTDFKMDNKDMEYLLIIFISVPIGNLL